MPLPLQDPGARALRDPKVVTDTQGYRYHLVPLADVADAERPVPGPKLTPRETQVAQLLTRGLGNKQIASACNISEGTVKTHVHRLFEKMGVSNRVELALRLLNR